MAFSDYVPAKRKIEHSDIAVPKRKSKVMCLLTLCKINHVSCKFCGHAFRDVWPGITTLNFNLVPAIFLFMRDVSKGLPFLYMSPSVTSTNGKDVHPIFFDVFPKQSPFCFVLCFSIHYGVPRLIQL
jgi:hypothetical protein